MSKKKPIKPKKPKTRGINRCLECSIPIPKDKTFCARHEDD